MVGDRARASAKNSCSQNGSRTTDKADCRNNSAATRSQRPNPKFGTTSLPEAVILAEEGHSSRAENRSTEIDLINICQTSNR